MRIASCTLVAVIALCGCAHARTPYAHLVVRRETPTRGGTVALGPDEASFNMATKVMAELCGADAYEVTERRLEDSVDGIVTEHHDKTLITPATSVSRVQTHKEGKVDFTCRQPSDAIAAEVGSVEDECASAARERERAANAGDEMVRATLTSVAERQQERCEFARKRPADCKDLDTYRLESRTATDPIVAERMTHLVRRLSEKCVLRPPPPPVVVDEDACKKAVEYRQRAKAAEDNDELHRRFAAMAEHHTAKCGRAIP